MEQREIELLRSKYFNLCRITNCSEELLSFFYENKILSLMDIETITSKIEGFQRASEFYRIIQTRTNAYAVLIEGLQRTRQTGVVKLLAGIEQGEVRIFMDDEEFNSEPSPGSSSGIKTGITFDVFTPVHSFTGREKEAQDLHQLVIRSRQAKVVTLTSQLTCLVGLGGIGKTQLTRYYVQKEAKDFDGNVIWFNAETENSLIDSFRRFSSNLNLTSRELKSINVVVAKVFKYFEGSKALFVFDNAEKVPWLRNFFPMSLKNPNLHFLITSREQEWDRGVEVMQLDGLSQNDAILLVKSGLKIKATDKSLTEDILELVNMLQFFPLALQQAIAYIYEQQITSSYTVQEYLKEFKEKEMLSFEDNSMYEGTFTTTTATIWRLTLEKIRAEPEHGRLASLILNVVAYLSADNIRRGLFYMLESINLVSDNSILHFEQINAAVRLLVRYSMVTGRENQTVLSVHRLVQTVTRNRLVQTGIEEQVLKVAVLLLSRRREAFPKENIPYALIVWRQAWKYNKLIQVYSWQVVNIVDKLANTAHEEGEGFGREALTKLEKVLGANHKHCLYLQKCIALILVNYGYYEKAMTILKDILSRAESLYANDIELFFEIKANLNAVVAHSGKLEEALDLEIELVKNTKSLFGEHHSNTIIAEANYGWALTEIGDLNAALGVFEKLIKTMSDMPENSKFLSVLQLQVGLIYFKKRNYKKALEILDKVYQMLKPNYTAEVDHFADICYNLGKIFIHLGKYEKALEILEENFENIKNLISIRPKIKTFEFQILIGEAYEGLGNIAKALELYDCARALMLVTLGENSPRFKQLSDYIDERKKYISKGFSLVVRRLKLFLFSFIMLLCAVAIFSIVFLK